MTVFLDVNQFEEMIENIVWDLDVSYLDAIFEYCDKNEVEYEDVVKLIKKSIKLKQKLEFEGIQTGQLKRNTAAALF